MTEVYAGREQTQTKHFILRRYLQELAFKVLQGSRSWGELVYVDGFSGPWHSRTEDFADTSFMIAIEVLKDVQEKIAAASGRKPRIRCYFCESDRKTFIRLSEAVRDYRAPSADFQVRTRNSTFVKALTDIEAYIGHGAFSLIFIDPTGWTGYPLNTIAPVLRDRSREVVINFMYDHINRFKEHSDPNIAKQFEALFGGPDWRDHLNPELPLGLALEELYRQVLKQASDFRHVASTRIDKSTSDRPHFFLVYGTNHSTGLKVFRDTERKALAQYEDDRKKAVSRKAEEKRAEAAVSDLFSKPPSLDAAPTVGTSLDDQIDEQKKQARRWVEERLKSQPNAPTFAVLCASVMEAFMLRETEVKDLCVALAAEGVIRNTWCEPGSRTRKPSDDTLLELVAQSS